MSNTYNSQLGNIMGSYKLVMVWNTESEKVTCQACGHVIKNVYVIENIETKERMNVGSECVEKLLGDRETIRILNAIKTIQSQVKTEYEKPIKNAQLKLFIEENKDIIKDMESDQKYKGEFYKNCLWRVNNNANADMTRKDIKDYTELSCKFTFTKEQKKELKELQQIEINKFLERISSK